MFQPNEELKKIVNDSLKNLCEEGELKKMINDSLKNLCEDQRRRTFRKWVFSKKDACNADKMAEAGFIYVGNKQEPDSVKCFFCGKTLDGWEPTDDPWQEHLMHAPTCSFAKLQKRQGQIMLDTFLDLKDELVKKTINDYCDALKEQVELSSKTAYEACCQTIDML